TNNPYDLSIIPGGSSGGEGALISSAGSIIGIGSDIGGSIRIPSYFCGIFGHKVTPGVVPSEGIFPPYKSEAAPFFTTGPMCRYAIDLKPMLKAMVGDQIYRLPKIDSLVDFSKIRIFYMLESKNPWVTPVSPEAKIAILKVVSHFEKTYNVSCTEVNIEEMGDAYTMWILAMSNSVSTSLLMTNNKGEINLLLETIRKLFGQSSHTLAALYFAFIQKLFSLLPIKAKFSEIKELKKQLLEILEDDYGVFLYPSFPEIDVKHDTTVFKCNHTCYTSVFNVTNLPVTQCALGLNSNGMPLGVQVAAIEYNDHLTIAVAEEIEKVFGGWVPPFKAKHN
ncbi:fatty-acid amide hydrolase 2-like protein, partial [Dinothrombium tinctorium]